MAAAVVGDFEDVAWLQAFLEKHSLGGFFCVSREQHAAVALGDTDDDGIAVQVGAGPAQARLDRCEEFESDPVVEVERHAAFAWLARRTRRLHESHHLVVGGGGVCHALIEEDPDGHGFEHLVHAADVVRVGVAGNHEVEALDSPGAEHRDDIPLSGASIDQDRLASGRTEQHRITLADIEDIDREVSGECCE